MIAARHRDASSSSPSRIRVDVGELLATLPAEISTAAELEGSRSAEAIARKSRRRAIASATSTGPTREHVLELEGRAIAARVIVPDDLKFSEWMQLAAFVERRAIIAETSELEV